MDRDELRRRKLQGPYADITLDNHLNIYDRLPYVRDINICNKDSIRQVSGNVIKYYRYHIQTSKIIDHQLS